MKEYKFKINGNEYNVAIDGIKDNVADVTVNGIAYKVDIESKPAGIQTSAPVAQPAAAQPAEPVAAKTTASAPASGKTIASPLPGVIIDICVKEGQAVKAGQKVAVLEAMKMENDILAEYDGTVTAIHVSKGESILEGAKIVTIG